jgi:nicotinate-nucleotide adenylyltransferase
VSSEAWDALDPSGPAVVHFLRRPPSGRITVLLGAFDPPTNAHLAVLGAASRLDDATGVLCLTKTLLARDDDVLLGAPARLEVLDVVAREHGLGLAVSNRGTYVDVAEALSAEGWDASFVIGSDKLAQLDDPSFYPDGEAGVSRTFASVRFVVVPRPDRVAHRSDLVWLDVADVFDDPAHADISATEVRRRLRAGEPIDGLVPQAVGFALGGYTSVNESGRTVPLRSRATDPRRDRSEPRG